MRNSPPLALLRRCILRSATALQGNALAAIAALFYLGMGGLWITVSDQVGELLFRSPEQLTRYQTYKGAGFVAATALLIFVMMRRATRDARDLRGAASAVGRRWPLGVLLALLAMSTALPLVALTAVALHRESEHAVQDANGLVSGVAETTAAATFAFLSHHQRLADMLVENPAVRALVPTRCSPVLAELLAARPELAEVQTVDAAGRVVCSARATMRRARLQPALLPPAVEPGQPVTAPPQPDGETGGWVVAMAYPLGEGLGGSVQLMVSLTALEPLVAAKVPDGGIIGIYSLDGYALARSAGAQRFVGRLVSDNALVDHVRKYRSGESVGVGPDRVERLYAFRPIGTSGWFSVTGVPTQTMYAGARSTAWRYGLAALCFLGLAGWLAMRISRAISLPMAALTATAQRVGAGHFDERAALAGPRELVEVARGFNRMLDRIPVIEQGLRESEERHRSLVELAPDGIVVHDAGRMIYANAGFRRMMGLAPDAPLDNLRLSDMALPEIHDCMRARLERLQAAPGVASPIDVTLRRADGSLVETEQSCCSAHQDGAVIVQTHLRDVTARNQARRELEQANQLLEHRIAERTAELNDANQALGAFTYSVAHDLRGPVGRLAGFADALADAVSAQDMTRAVHYADRIAHNARAMNTMIEGLLRLAHAGRSPLEYTPVDMGRLVANVVADLECPAGLVSVDALPVVQADVATIRQVWFNLLSNAVKYSARRDGAQVRVQCRDTDSSYLFSVADNGVGFDAAEARGLFQVFQRLPGSAGYEGSGVGLAIVRRIVERHGGKVWAESSPGNGATFFFTLPRQFP